MARGLRRRRIVDRLATVGAALLIGSVTILGTAVSTAIAANSTDLTPSATSTGTWADAGNALNGSDDGLVATTATNNADQSYRTFGYTLPTGSIVTGITIKVEAASTDPSGCQLGVSLSGDGGNTFTNRQPAGLTDVSTPLTFGGTSDDWGYAWDASQLSNTSFRVVLRNLDPGSNCTNGSTTSVDRLWMVVSYTTMGGGSNNATLSADVCDTADFNFIIDMSGSIGAQGNVPSNLQQLKDGINGFVAAFQAAGGDGRYSGTRFSGSSATTLTSGYVSDSSFQSKVTALSGPSGLTPTASGINTGAANFANDRPGAPNVMFVVTDGSPNIPNSHGDDLNNPDTWLTAANAAITAANNARAGSGASKYVVKAVYLSTSGDPGDTSLPFSNAGDAAWAQAVMTNIGGGAYFDADFKSFAADLLKAIHCAPPPPTIKVTKTANPTSIGEPGGNVTFTVDVQNIALDPVKLDSLVDDVYGNLDGKGTCDTGGTIAGGDTYSCHFSGAVSGAPGSTHKDTVTADASNANGKATDSDDATVTITDVLPTIDVTKTANPTSVMEPGGTVTFSVTVHNTSPEAVSLDSLVDSVYGDLNGQGTCVAGGSIASGDTYSCHFDGAVSGNAGSTHKDIVTATASDNEQNQVKASDDAIVTIGDVLPTISVVKTASPTAVDEPGGDVTFTVDVHNSSIEAVTLDSLVDNVFGNLAGKGNCATGSTIAVGGTYSCQFVEPITGNAGDVHHDTATATASDDDGNHVSAHDDATVTIRDVKPAIGVVKSAFPTTIGEPGGTVTFSVRVENHSLEAVTLDALVDDVYGNLDGKGTCDTGGTIAAGGHYDCEFDGQVTGNAGTVHVDTVTATASDDEKNPATAHDDASVTITDVPISIAVDKQATPTSVPEPGATVTFSVVVANNGTETITLDSLVDDVYGDLDGQGSCALPQIIPAGGQYSCAFFGAVSGNAGTTHKDTVTATGSDDDNGHATAQDDATVDVTDVLPTISVDKTATPGSLPAAGGSATFQVVVTNHSVEPVTITSLVDDVYGDLNGKGTCAVGAVLAPDASYTCSFVGDIPAKAGEHVDIVTAIAVDDEQNPATNHDDAVVTVAKPAPSTEVKSATGKPHITPPPTDTDPMSVQPSDAGLPALLLGILAIGIAVFFAVPRRAPARVRAKARRR